MHGPAIAEFSSVEIPAFLALRQQLRRQAFCHPGLDLAAALSATAESDDTLQLQDGCDGRLLGENKA